MVGSSNFTEVTIQGEMYTELIEANTDYEVEQRFGLAGAAVCFDALENDQIDRVCPKSCVNTAGQCKIEQNISRRKRR